MIKFNARECRTKDGAAYEMKQLIHSEIEELKIPIKEKLLGATSARDSARYGGELSALLAVQGLLADIEII